MADDRHPIGKRVQAKVTKLAGYSELNIVVRPLCPLRLMWAQWCAASIDENPYTNLGNQRIAASGSATYCLSVAQMAIRVWRLD